MKRIGAREWCFIGIVIAMALLPLAVQSPYFLVILIFIGLNALLALGLSLIIGYAGQVSLGHAAFYGIGAYTSAILTTRVGLSPWLALIAAVLVTMAISFVLGRMTLPLSGDYLAMATLAFGIVVQVFFVEARDLTGGSSGIVGIPPLALGSFAFVSEARYYYLVWAAVVPALLFSRNLVRSRPGLALQALRDSTVGAEAAGVDVAHYKVVVFMIGGAFAGLAGGLYAHYVLYLSPSPFTFVLTISIVTMAVIGGMANIWGTVLGAAIVTALGEVLRGIVPMLAGGATGEYEIIVFGLLLVAVMLFQPEGLADPLARAVRRLFSHMPAGPGGGHSHDGTEHRPVSSGLAHVATKTRSARLDVVDVVCQFGGVVAVDHVSLSVEPGQIVAVIGPNGAGKTTLLNIITGLITPQSGEVRLGDRRLTRLRPSAVAAHGIARTFQNLQLFPRMSVLANVVVGMHTRASSGILASTLGLPSARREDHAAREAALAYLDHIGLPDLAEQPAGSLSFGQQRLLEIARALAASPVMLLLDEPAAGLSGQEVSKLAGLIREISAAGVGVLLIEHDMALVFDLAEVVVVMDQGQKIAQGHPDQIEQDPQVISAYLGADVVGVA